MYFIRLVDKTTQVSIVKIYKSTGAVVAMLTGYEFDRLVCGTKLNIQFLDEFRLSSDQFVFQQSLMEQYDRI